MDLNDGGTETQMISNLTNKPRPPPQILKPKPSLPKKPAIAAKPGNLLEKSASLNEHPPVPRAKPSVKEKTPQRNRDDSPKSSPQRTPSSRPKQPPPPLPKAAPKGSAVQKTPPPLPKTPPRASLKNRENCGQVEDIKVNGDDKSLHVSAESNSVVQPSEQKVVPSTNAENDTNTSDCDKTPENDSVEEKSENDSENFTFANLKSKFLTSKSSSNSVPKVPDKPKPSIKTKSVADKNTKVVNKPNAKCDESDAKVKSKSADIVVELQGGQSTWFVDTEQSEGQETSVNDVKKDSGIHFLKGQGKAAGDSTVWFNKHIPVVSPKHSPKSSPKNSPTVPRKPPPRVTPKPKPTCDSNPVTDNEKTISGSSSAQSSPDKSVKLVEDPADTFHTVQDRDQSPVAGHDNELGKTDKTNDLSNTTEKPKPKGSPKPLPKPVPRRPAPATRPRPTPRKRLSINRLSGSDETFDNLACRESGNNQSNEAISNDKNNAVIDTKRNTFVVEPSENTQQDNSEQNTAAESGNNSVNDTKRNTFVEEQLDSNNQKIVDQEGDVDTGKAENTVEDEVQYRVIDKQTRSQSHITELEPEADADDHVVILRTKVAKEENENDDEGLEITLEELKSIGHLLEGSDDEDHEHDKFMRKVDLPVEKENSYLKDVSESTNGQTVEKENLNLKTVREGSNEKTVEKDNVNLQTVSKHTKDRTVEKENLKVQAVCKETDGQTGKGKNSYNELLDDKSILEPTSLLNEIEDILTRSFKHSSLTRSGSSPEKKSSPYLKVGEVCKTARSHSVDVQTPVRPPRPKKEQKRLRSMSQAVYDSCGSDTESLPDMSWNRDDHCNSTNISLTLGKAKPHPPKPKRHKLLKVQRSQSDVTSMKSIVDKMDVSDSKSPRQKRLAPESAQSNKICNESKNKPSTFKKRPTRKAPEPPKGPAFKVTPPSASRLSLETVVPLDVRVKSMSLDSRDAMRSKRDCRSMMNPAGAFYHCINDDDVGSSDGDHDYQDISDNEEKYRKVVSHNSRQAHMTKVKKGKHNESVSPPKLPPRNMNNSHSFDNSSLSSAGHDFDSVITSVASSAEDMSISSGCFEHDINSPGIKHPLMMRSKYPKTSSPYVKGKIQTESDENVHISGLGPSNSSLSDCMDDRRLRPVSGCSIQSDSWSGSAGAEQSSSDTDVDDEEKITRKREKKLFMIAQEIASSEHVFVDVLKLLNVDFRLHVTSATEKLGRPIIPTETLNRILDYLPQLEIFNEGLLKDLEERIRNWEEKKCISDIFVKKGPFLKLYSSYIRDFETITSTLDEALKKYPQFLTTVKEFELSPRCACLALKHYMLKPIQRIPQYRLLLQDYMKHLPADCPEMKDMQTALAIVSEVAHHANENMRREDYVQKMLEIQRSLIGQFEVIKPGRLFLKEGELKKLSRKEMQPRYFFLFNDVLLYTTPVATGYRLNNVLPLAGMKVSVAAQDEYKMEFSIISVQRSFTLHGTTLEERDDWVTALNAAIEENALKRNTFEAVRAGAQFWEEHLQSSWDTYQALLDKDFVLGHKAPLWIPDARVTMCMLCTCEFTVTWRRHHCRACGWVVCGNCSEGKAPLRYLKYKPARVCDKCFKTLSDETEKKVNESPEKDDSVCKDEEDGGNSLSLNGLFERFQKIRRSGQRDKKNTVRPDRLKEVAATDQDASMSGYLQKWHKGKKWKKKQWFLVRDKVLYTFKASQDTAAASSMVLLGYEVSRFTDYFEGVEAELLFQLSHANTAPVVFRTDSATATEKWVTVMRESTVA